jgi:isochorismate pyruvate lyase
MSHEPSPKVPSGKEPSPTGAPLRKFRDPAYVPLASSLGELRAKIDALDDQLVALMAERAMCVKDAARFKRDSFQVAAPARQAEVFAKVRALAEKHNRGFRGFPDVTEATWRAMVAAFIAAEQTYFNDLEVLGDA